MAEGYGSFTLGDLLPGARACPSPRDGRRCECGQSNARQRGRPEYSAEPTKGCAGAYGVHSYPSAGQPGNPTAAAQRAARLNSVDLAECRAKGTAGGKPCWITEWGFPNPDLSCPAEEAGRTLLIEELRNDFAAAAAEHRLAGIDYFSWNSDPWAKQTGPDSVYRCGALTESGRRAIAPHGQQKRSDLGDSIRIRVGVPLVTRGPAPNIAGVAQSCRVGSEDAVRLGAL
jgi:hypothetical protein